MTKTTITSNIKLNIRHLHTLLSQDKNITMKSNIKLNIRQLHELLSPDERNHNEVQHKVQHKIFA